MGKSQCCDERGLKKGVWTEEEDQKLLSCIKKHGEGGWRLLPKKAGLSRCGKSCRLRWANYLRPGIRRGDFSPEEEQTIIRLHALLGNRWATIARHLYRRTDNEIKNHWNTRLKKRLVDSNIAVEHLLADSNSANIPNNNKPDDHRAESISTTQCDVAVCIEHVVSGQATSAVEVVTPLLPNLSCPIEIGTSNRVPISPKLSDMSGDSCSSSRGVLNKIASRIGSLNTLSRHALVGSPAHNGLITPSNCGTDGIGDGFNFQGEVLDLRSPTVTDSSTTRSNNNVEGAFDQAASFFSEVCGGKLMCQQSAEFQFCVEELLTAQGPHGSFNWKDFDDVTEDLD